MSRQVSQRLQHSGRVDMIYIADPTTNAVFGTVDPFPIEIAEQSLDLTISGAYFDGSMLMTTVSGFTFVGDSLKTTSTLAVENLYLTDVTISGHLFDADSNLKVTGPVSVSGSVFSNDATVSGNNLYTTTRAVDSGINYTGNITALTTYTSSAELTYEPDVGMFVKAISNTVTTGTAIGILKFQFSPDNVNWSTFPVAGFEMASNIWEFHTAVKLPRYFRYSFDNCASTDCSLDAYAYYGHQLRQGSLPLSQSIGADNDAIVTRSVGIGQEPDGTYKNVKKDGSAFRTTANLQGTTLQTTMTSGLTGNISLGATSGFGTSGYIYIGSEFIQYTAIVDSSQITIPSTGRGAFGSTADTHAIGDTVGEVYTTGILTLDGYTEVATKLLCSNTGRMRFQWYTDSAGTDTIRTLAPPYSIINNYDFLGAPNFGPYVRYTFANTQSSATTDFYFETEFYTKAISAQVLTLGSTVVSGMTANVVRAVGTGENPRGTYDNTKQDGYAFRTTTNLQGTTLSGSLNDSAVGAQNIFTSTSGFPASGYIYINSEFIQYDSVDSGTQLTLTTGGRGSFGTEAASHASSDVVGEVYTTGILTLEGYTEVATKLLCSNTGRMRFQWYSDSAGTDTIRTIGPPYTTINTYDYLGAPNFGPYVRYTFANTQSSATTDFYFETEFYTKAISAQVLTLGSTIVNGMTANLGRNIVVGEQPDGDFVNVPTDGNASSTDASLGAGASYSSLWIDTDGYNTIEIFVRSDVSSATQGLAVAFSNDTGAVDPIPSFVKYYNYNQTDIDNGYKLLTLPTALDGYKITYTNGDASQSTFDLNSTLKTNGLQITDRLDSGLTDDREASVVRSVTLGKNPANSYVNTRQDGYVLYIDGSLNLPYLSSILDTDGYTQIQTDLFCDVSGTLTGTWYNDSNQTATMRTFTFPYNASRTLESFSSPVFARYLTYGFSVDGSAQAFNFGLKFLTKSLSGQVLGTTSTVVGSMVANLGRNILMGQDKASNFKNVPIDVEGNIKISVPTTAFGQLKTSEETPLIEQYFPYGVLTDEVNTWRMVTGVTANGGSGTGLLVDYDQTGNAVRNIYTNRGNTGVNYALDDIITISAGNLDSTGIIRSVTSTGIVLALDVCVGGTGYAAADGSINTIDSLMYLTVSGAYDKTVVETKDYVKYHTGTGVITRNTAIFEPSAGSYQFVGPADTNDGFLCGFVDTSFCIVRRRNGIDNITYQNSFNVDTLDGTGGARNPSGINSNFTYGNVYEIKYQWLGFGAVKFSIEDGDGNLELYHTIQYANANTGVSIVSPSQPFRWEIGNTTNTSNLTLKSASAMAAVEGKRLYPNRLYTANTNSSALVLQNQKYFNNRVNKSELFINSIIISNNTTNADIIFTIRKAVSDPTVSTYTVPNENSIVSKATPASGYTALSGDIIGVYALNKGQSQNIRVSQYEIALRPMEYISINPSIVGSSSITVTWYEDK